MKREPSGKILEKQIDYEIHEGRINIYERVDDGHDRGILRFLDQIPSRNEYNSIKDALNKYFQNEGATSIHISARRMKFNKNSNMYFTLNFQTSPQPPSP